MCMFKKMILPLLAFGALSTACNDIDGDERFIDLPPIESDRVVLLEDYTGQGCTNCPDAHEVMSQLQSQYPGQIVCVSIHSGDFAVPVTNTAYTGLKQPFGDGMGAYRHVDEYPSGVIDGNGPSLHTDWAAGMRKALEEKALCGITIGDFSYNADTRILSGTVTLMPGVSGTGNLGIWLIEDGIVARQVNHGKIIRDYVHNHVMRAYATASVWGDPVELTREEETVKGFSVEIDPSWKVENLAVAVFVTDASTGVYLQSAVADVR